VVHTSRRTFSLYYNNDGFKGYIARASLSDFSSSGVTYLNLADTNTNLKGFHGGFTDGTFGYFVPYNNDTTRKMCGGYCAPHCGCIEQSS
jgi:hypothetical protein